MGAITALLTAWDIHNWHVIMAMGMAWDTGAPVWPYQTSDILLRLLNAPADFLAIPIGNLLGLVAPNYDLVCFPCSLLWWWAVGLYLDRRVPKHIYRRRRLTILVVATSIVILLSSALISALDTLRWWARHGSEFSLSNALLAVRFLTPTLWLAVLTIPLLIHLRKAAIQQE
jgi:hypothetical protein